MTNVFAIHSVGNSVITYLHNTYPGTISDPPDCRFRLLSSGELPDMKDSPTTLSLYLYRINVNEHLRNLPRPPGSPHPNVPLALDLHYLLTVWATSALTEHTVMAWAMRELYLHPVLDRSYLTPEANWDAEDAVQILPSELTNEEMMRIWDSIEPHYRLSVPYVARAVRIDPDTFAPASPVVATRFQFSDQERVP